MKMKEVTLNRPNFLGSEKGLVTKTITIPNTQTTGVVGVASGGPPTANAGPKYGLAPKSTPVGGEPG